MTINSAYQDLKSSDIDNDNMEIAIKYGKGSDHGTGYLGYRDLPIIIDKHVKGNKALDYGCGPGYSSWLLKSLGVDVVGVDISEHMLAVARKTYQSITFYKTKIGELPFNDHSFDLVLSTFVLFDIPSIEEVVRYLSQARRVLKPAGVFIAVTGSDHFHKNNWLSAQNDIEKNQRLISGEMYKVKLLDDDITFHDFYYAEADYARAFSSAGLERVALYHPLGKSSDNIPWFTEWDLPPYSIYVCRPKE